MRFSSYINNQRCLEWGLNANQGALFDLLNQAVSWANEVIIDGTVFYWVSRNEVIRELPLFYAKPDTVYRHFVDLDKKELIEYRKVDGKDLIRLTIKGKKWNEFNSDLNPNNPSELGNKSESTRIEIRKSSDLNPTNNNTNNNNTSDHNNPPVSPQGEPSPDETKISVRELLKEFGITGQLAEDFIAHRKFKKSPITERSMKFLQGQADLAKIPISLAVEIVLAKGSWVSFQAGYDWQPVAASLGWGVSQPTKSHQGGFIPDDSGNWGEGMTITIRGQE